MIKVIAEDRALKTLDRYFNLLGKTGYVKRDIMKRFLVYLFFIDLLEYTYDFFTEEDYNIVDAALGKLFATGGCMLPYPVFCDNRIILGRAHYMGDFRIRVTEALRLNRISEDGILRMAL